MPMYSRMAPTFLLCVDGKSGLSVIFYLTVYPAYFIRPSYSERIMTSLEAAYMHPQSLEICTCRLLLPVNGLKDEGSDGAHVLSHGAHVSPLRRW